MPTNPSYQNTSGIQLSGENHVNDPKPHVRHRSNSFNRSYPHITTARYGDIVPFYVEDAVEKDTIPLNSRHEVRTPTMLSQFLGELEMKKAYMEVPLRAIYPKNYDLMKVPPVQGDDIPMNNTAFIHSGFFQSLLYYISSGSIYDSTDYVRFLLLLEKFFSRASLFERLGCHLSCCFEFKGINVSFLDGGESFDLMFEKIADHLFNGVEFGGNRYWIKLTDTVSGRVYYPYGAQVAGIPARRDFVSLHWILEKLRENPLRYSALIFDGLNALDSTFVSDLLAGISFNVPNNINIERIISYQLSCIEYCTDDHIDNIYSTDLWRNMMNHFFNQVVSVGYFSLNGVDYPYDYSSSVFWSSLADSLLADVDLFSIPGAVEYIWNIVSVRKSLRYEDYFVGGRISPLAIGDVSAPVVNGEVNAYEITRSQVYQRYLNAVNLSGPEFDTYQKEILDNTAPPRQDVPKFLAMTRSSIRGYEVENTTSDDQGAIVTNVRSQGERFAFDVTLDHESIIIGVLMFEARRMYSKTVDRQFYYMDRYDRFIPNLQYLGDQDISRAELRADEPLDEPFAYGVRNGELKQRVGIVSGGVVDFLKSWVMVTDVVDSYDDNENLDSDYIRSKNVEFDRFFAITNNSDAGWFHFIIELHNISNPIRPMDVAPNVLI